jgi:sugar/nucleoside kinase (ribokinase family)
MITMTKTIAVVGHIFEDIHMSMPDSRIIGGAVQYAQDAYKDEGGIATVYRAIEGCGLYNASLKRVGIGYATIINRDTPIVYLDNWNADDVLTELAAAIRVGDIQHIHIAYLNILPPALVERLPRLLAYADEHRITVSADLAPHHGEFCFDDWYDVIDIWIAHAIDLVGIDSSQTQLVIAHSATGSVTEQNGKVVYRAQAPDIDERQIANTTGAGDTFAGVFLSHYLSHGRLEEAINSAHLEATGAVMRKYNAGRFKDIEL